MSRYYIYQAVLFSGILLCMTALGLLGAFGHPYIIDIFHAHASTGSCK